MKMLRYQSYFFQLKKALQFLKNVFVYPKTCLQVKSNDN